MRHNRLWLPLIGGLLVTVAGCATGEEWSTWKQHPTHFASGGHMSFSLRNRAGVSPRVSRTDIAKARAEEWWGKSITVGQEQILER